MALALLDKAGYEIRKLQNSPAEPANTNSASRGTIIEFIGPSGSGKSYLFEKSWPKLKGCWGRYPERMKVEDYMVPAFAPYWSLLASAVQGLSHSLLNDYQRAKVLRQLASIIVKDSEIRTQLDRSGFILQEGLFHNFPQQLLQLPDSDFQMASAARALILLIPSSPQTIIDRRRARVGDGGHLSTWQSGMSETEQLEEIESRCAIITQLAARAENFGVACLRLTAEDPIGQLVSSVFAFAKQLTKTR